MTDFGLTDGYYVHDGLDQEEGSIYGYRLNSHFISKNGHVESWAECSSFFAAGAFVDDTIWVGSSLSATQHILNVVNEFFQINDISINNDKTVTISINSRISNPSLSISGLSISVAKKGEFYRYLDIFFSIEGFSKSSLVRVYSDVHFFTNLVLKKAVSDKQFLYLVLAVLHFIVGYRTQFTFVPVGVCNKWDALIYRGLKLKSGLLLDFSSDTIYYLSFYGLNKVASLVSFANSGGILGVCSVTGLMTYRFCVGDLSIHWFPLFIFLSLNGSLASFFQFYSRVPMSVVLDKFLFCKFLPSFQHYGVVFQWKRLDPHGPVPKWFDFSVVFLEAPHFSPLVLANAGPLDICGSNDFVSICDYLSQVGAGGLSMYMDSSLKNLGMVGCKAGAAAFFEDINLGLGVSVHGLLSSILTELQTIVLALKYMPVAHSAALDACSSEFDLMCPDFRNQCWVECQHIRNHKVKDHSGISENDCTDSIANAASLSGWYFSPHVSEHFLLADGGVVSDNFKHFVCDVFRAVCHAHWKVGSGFGFLDGGLCSDIDWLCSSRALHCQLPMAVQKHMYNKCYPSVLCLYCGKVEVFDHVFSCVRVLSGLSFLFSVSSAFYKGFVFNDWLWKTISIFHDPKVAGIKIVDFVHSICLAFRNDVWLVCAKHHTFMEKNGLIPIDSSIFISVSGLALKFSAGVIKLLGIAKAFGVRFGFCKSCSFFLGISNLVSVNIST
ncbi:hypothetical protein G9A89_011949 [Geosiphon pyriformis]|nr:hypothetical protein G9A89_011949 [Geosiphon pyriformis]